MALKDELIVVLGGPGPHTPESIYDSFDDRMKRISRNPDYIEFTLSHHPKLFRRDESECWSLVDIEDREPAEPVTVPSSPPLQQPSDGTTDHRAVERELRDALTGSRLVCETGVDAGRNEQLTKIMHELSRHLGPAERIAQRYPAIFVTFLVAHGIYQYQGGAYWKSMTVPGIDTSAGQPFEDAVRHLGLETFGELVESEDAWRYVAPILAHGGIPKYCLDDYFSLILKDLDKVNDASELLSLWRTRRSTFVGMGKPVRRFVLYGGDVAVDFIDRTVELFREHAQTGQILHPDTAGLPRHVCTRFKHFVAGKDLTRITRRRGVHQRATISFDPWEPTGPALELPPSNTAGPNGAWLVSGEGRVERIPSSTQVERSLSLSPARSWSVELTDSYRTISATVFEGVGDLQALFFDPATGRIVRTAGGINLNEVWILHPSTVTITAVDSTGNSTPLRVTQQLPYPSGDWSGYSASEASLADTQALLVESTADGDTRRVNVRSPSARPSLLGEAPSRITTDDGNDVYTEVPLLRMPDLDPAASTRWRIRLTVDGEPEDVEPGDLEVSDDGLILPIDDGCHRVDLVVRGPLGADLRTSFAVAPGLDVAVPERLLFPGDRAVVYAQAPRLRIDGSAPGNLIELDLPPDKPGATITVADDSGRSLELNVALDRLLWATSRGAADRSELGVAPAIIPSQALFDADPPRLLVHVGQADHSLRLELTGDDTPLQSSDTVKRAGRGGRWVFDLARFADTIRNSESTRFTFILWVGSIPVRVATVRLTLEVNNLIAIGQIAGDIACVEASFDPLKPRKHRVARLWSLTRPWEDPIVENIPEEAASSIEIYGAGTIPLGKYLLEVAIDDGWSAPSRPKPNTPGTTRVTVGTPAEIRNRSLPASDPMAELEAALSNGHYSRELDHDELTAIVPAATETLMLMLRGDLLQELGSLQFQAVRNLVLADEPLFGDAVQEAYFSDQFDPLEFLRLSITTIGEVAGQTAFSPTLARSLWEIAPALSMAVESGPGGGQDAADRIDELTGWRIDSNPDEIARGQPVTQQFLGMSIDQLDNLGPAIDLVPKQALDIDTLVDANFEWLRTNLTDPGTIDHWWTKYRGLTESSLDRFPTARAHLEARIPPAGTESHAALPLAILDAALETVADTQNSPIAIKALLEATAFAPKLVRHDLILALALLRYQPDLPASSTDEDPK